MTGIFFGTAVRVYCMWDNRDRMYHYKTGKWPAHEEPHRSRGPIKDLLLNSDRILDLPMHIKLGLMQFASFLDKGGNCSSCLHKALPGLKTTKKGFMHVKY